MKWSVCLLLAVAILAGIVVSQAADEEAAPIFVTKIPPGYRDWRLISVAREEGNLDDIRAVLGNDKAIKFYREGKLPFPDGAIIARLAWSYERSDENNRVFDRPQSFVAGHPKNGVQFMVKNSRKYASTGGWGFAQFDDGKSAKGRYSKPAFPATRPSQVATLSSPATRPSTYITQRRHGRHSRLRKRQSNSDGARSTACSWRV